MVPEEGKTLGEVCDVTKLAGFEYTSHFDYSVGGEIIAVRSLNIKNGAFDFSNVQTIPKETSQALPRSKLRSGDIVMGYVGTIGNAAMVTKDDHLHLAPNVALIRPKAAYHPMFVFQQVLGPNFQQQLSILTTTTSQPALSMTNLRKAKFWLPPLAEQRKIADILSTWDQAIEKTEALLSNARTQKRALMQQLLTGKRRFPAFEGQAWKEVRLGDVAVHVTSGSRGWSEYYSDDGDVFVRITNLTRASIKPDWVSTKHVTLPNGMREGLRTRLQKNDVLISITADLGVIGFIDFEPKRPHYINQHICLVRFAPTDVDPSFIAYYLASSTMQKAIARLNDAGAKAGLSLPTIRSIPLQFPSLPEQRKIAELLGNCDGEVLHLERLITKLRTEKKALMQQLLTGKRRVVV